MRDPWILIVLGAALIIVPMWISRWESGSSRRPGGLRDRVQTATRSDAGTTDFFAGLRIGIEIAGAILIGIGILRAMGYPV